MGMLEASMACIVGVVGVASGEVDGTVKLPARFLRF